MLVKISASSLKQGRWYEYLARFLLGGAATTAAGLISAAFGASIGGLFLAMPAIFCASATLIERHEIRRKLRIDQCLRHVFAVLKINGAGFGQSQPARRPMQELRTEPLFKLADLAADGGFRQPQIARRGGETAALHNFVVQPHGELGGLTGREALERGRSRLFLRPPRERFPLNDEGSPARKTFPCGRSLHLNFSRERRNPVEGDHLIYGFLATEPNAFVAPVHAKAMPVILTTKEEHDTSDASPWSEAKDLRRPILDNELMIVAQGASKQDGVWKPLSVPSHTRNGQADD